MPAERVRQELESQALHYAVHPHERAVTAQEMAAVEHTSGWQVAKPVMVMLGGELVMAVVPAAAQLSVPALAEAMGVSGSETRLAAEPEFVDSFPDCEPGAEPPFGGLYGMRTIVDEHLVAEEQITFAAGSHTESMTMRVEDWLAVEQPNRAPIAAMADLA